MSSAGFEWLVIDLEHTSIDLSTAHQLIATIQANNMKALVRVSKNEEVIIKRVLDMGADGIVVPMVKSQSDAKEAVERVKNFANSMKVDVANKEGDHIGPVVSKTQFDKIQSLIQVGIDEGAKVVAGGLGKPEGLNKGYFVKPTAFADVNNQMQIARTEIFGPVLCIIPFETEEEAIAIANDTPYGLLNFIQTQDQEKANRVARKLRSGMVDINGAGLAPDAPFGGYKHSGIGREAGKLGLEEYLEVKVVSGWND
jgi:aldehyde dehydrogenase (NAD+)